MFIRINYIRHHITLPLRLLLIAVVMAVALPCRARNNPIKTDDQLSIYDAIASEHLARMEVGLAINTYLQAVDYAKANMLKENLAIIYRRISECYEELYRYKDMLKYAEEGLAVVDNYVEKQRLLRYAAYSAFMMQKYDIFAHHYAEYVKTLGHKPTPDSDDYMEGEMEIMKLLNDHYLDEAMRHIQALKSTIDRRQRLLIEYYRLKGDYLKMTQMQTVLFRSRIRMQDSVRSNNFVEMNSRFINQKLEYQNQQLELDRQKLLTERQTTELKNTNLKLANTQLTLKNSSLELRRAKSASDLLTLSYSNQKLEADKLRNDLKAEEANKRLHEALVISILAISILVLVAVALYILNRRKLMKKLRHANEQLEQNNNDLIMAREKAIEADHVKTVFIQNMSHEIRTPLNAIVGFSDLIAKDDGTMDDDTRALYAHSIRINSDNLVMLVGDVLDTSQLESGTYNLQYRSATIGEVCRKALVATGQHKAQGVAMRLETDALENYIIHTDVKRVVQVLVNLLTNAEKNTTEGSITLGCSTTVNPGMVTFSVTDTGCGVPPDKVEEIFKSFVKLDQFKQGLGLGLHICRIIADLLGGSIYLDTSYTGGARFLFAIKAS